MPPTCYTYSHQINALSIAQLSLDVFIFSICNSVVFIICTFVIIVFAIFVSLLFQIWKMCRLTRILVILVLISRNHYAIAFVAGGVIWSRNLGNFISIANVSTFAAERQHFLSRSRALEIHNFENEVLKLAYYEVSYEQLKYKVTS